MGRREPTRLPYGELEFKIRKPGGTDGMEAFLILLNAAIPAFIELARSANSIRGLFSKVRSQVATVAAEGATAVSQATGGAGAVATGAQSPAGEAAIDWESLLPVVEAFRKLVGSLSREEREELRERLLFAGHIEVIHPDPRPTAEGNIRSTLTREVWDDLLAGDPFGAWYVFFKVTVEAVGKSSPAIAALRSRGAGTTPSSSGT